MQPLSQWSMEITTLCTIVASLRVVPNRSQFFMFESVALSCVAAAAAGRVRRNTSHASAEECGVAWGKRNKSHCVINDLHALDTGAYWCEAGDGGGCGPEGAVNIAVTGGSLILESPVLPVQEGQSVTLRCTSETPSSSKRPRFFKDGVLLGGGGATGNMTIRSVSKSDEGLYGCVIIGVGESLSSWLAVRGVRAVRPESSRFSLACILLPVVAVCLLLASTATLLRVWRNRKGKVNGEVSYADVTIAPQEVPPKHGENENSPTFYSTIKA